VFIVTLFTSSRLGNKGIFSSIKGHFRLPSESYRESYRLARAYLR
jgi:hypothetical protein